MTRDNIVSLISKETFLSQVAVNKVIDSLFDNIERALMRDEKVQFTGFGTFEPKRRAARIGRNPHTKEAVPIPARIVPSFKPGTRLMQSVCRDIK